MAREIEIMLTIQKVLKIIIQQKVIPNINLIKKRNQDSLDSNTQKIEAML